jgi:hypothetical protein
MKTNSEINFFSITFGDWKPPKSIYVFEILISFLDQISPIKTGLEPTTYSVEIFNTYLLHPVATSHRGYHTIANDWAGQFPIARSSGWLSRRVCLEEWVWVWVRLWKDETLPLGFWRTYQARIKDCSSFLLLHFYCRPLLHITTLVSRYLHTYNKH